MWNLPVLPLEAETFAGHTHVLMTDDGMASMLRPQGIGFGGTTMTTAEDYIICEVIDESTAECIDRQSVGRYDPRGYDHLPNWVNLEVDDSWNCGRSCCACVWST